MDLHLERKGKYPLDHPIYRNNNSLCVSDCANLLYRLVAQLSNVIDCGMYLVYMVTFSYLADSYTLYASSALLLVPLSQTLFSLPPFTELGVNVDLPLMTGVPNPHLRAQSFFQSLLGGVAPLFTNYLYQNLGITGGGSLIAGIGENLFSM